MVSIGPSLRPLIPQILLAATPFLAFILWLGISGTDPAPWQISLFIAWFALLGWIYSYRRYRHYADTPQAPISSAPQGYISIEGIGRALSGDPLRSPINYLPCLWYRILIETRDHDGDWSTETDETSDSSFILEDARGARCYVDPVGASVETLHKDKLKENDRRTTQWLLIPGTRIHAIGHFESRRPIEDRDSIQGELRDKLADWKSSGHAKRHYDQDRNGELDLAEWEQVRIAAQQEVMQEREAAADIPAYHCLRAPQDSRPFIISDRPPEQVRRRYQLQAWTLLSLFFLALILTARMSVES